MRSLPLAARASSSPDPLDEGVGIRSGLSSLAIVVTAILKGPRCDRQASRPTLGHAGLYAVLMRACLQLRRSLPSKRMPMQDLLFLFLIGRVRAGARSASCPAAPRSENEVSGLYLLCALIAVGLFGYLLVALFNAGELCDAYPPVLDPAGRLPAVAARRSPGRSASGSRRVAEGRLPRWLAPVVWLERALYRLAGVDPRRAPDWKRYAVALVAFNVIGVARRLCLAAPPGRAAAQPPGHGRGRGRTRRSTPR